MTDRNFKQELSYFYYRDEENGNDIESIDYENLIGLLREFHRRIKRLEADVESIKAAQAP